MDRDELIIPIEFTDKKGRPIRASRCSRLKARVWTQNPNEYVVLMKDDVRSTKEGDALVVSKFRMRSLETGVVMVTYDLLPKGASEDKAVSRTVSTATYWPNVTEDRHHHGGHCDNPHGPKPGHHHEGKHEKACRQFEIQTEKLLDKVTEESQARQLFEERACEYRRRVEKRLKAFNDDLEAQRALAAADKAELKDDIERVDKRVTKVDGRVTKVKTKTKEALDKISPIDEQTIKSLFN